MAQIIDIPLEDLPVWMRRARRRWDWGVLLAAAFGLLAAWPFIVHPGLPRTNASENYVYLVADYSDALREGRLYPRWSPHVLSGYGAPIPHYFPPLAPYSAALIKVLFTNDAVRAVRVIFSGAFIVAAASLYAFVRRRTTPEAGLLAVLLYIFNPYVGYTVPYIRGELAEFLALALLPVVLWSLDYLLIDNRPMGVAFCALAEAALLLVYPPMAAAALALTSVLIVFHFVSRNRPAWRLAVVSLILAIGVTAFFWLPAVAEANLVRWIERPTAQIITTPALFSSLQPVDLSELIPRPQFTLGLIGLLMSAASAGVAIGKRQATVFYIVFLAVGAAFIMIGLLIIPQAVWLLGAASLCLALTGAVLALLQNHIPPRWRRTYSAGLLTLVLMLSLPVLKTPRWPSSFGSVEPIDQITYEQRGAGIAVLPPGYNLPTTLPDNITPNRLLLSSYEAGNINRIVPIQAVNRTQINLLSYESHRIRYQVLSDTRSSVEMLTAYFPGWQTIAFNQNVGLANDEQTGLMRLDIPPMNGELIVTLGPTAVRQTAWSISALALLALTMLTWWRVRYFDEQNAVTADFSLLPAPEARLLSLLVGAFASIVIFFTTPSAPVSLYDQRGHGLASAMQARFNTNAGLEALAHAVNTTSLNPGDTLELTLYWQALRTLPANYQIQVSLIESASGEVILRTNLRAPGHYPTSRWRTYLYVRDQYQISIPPDISSGEYRIAVEVFECNPECSNRLTFFNVNGQNIGQILHLPTNITIKAQ